MTPLQALAKLENMGVITTDERDSEYCCGQMRSADGRCTHREYHAIYVEVGK